MAVAWREIEKKCKILSPMSIHLNKCGHPLFPQTKQFPAFSSWAQLSHDMICNLCKYRQLFNTLSANPPPLWSWKPTNYPHTIIFVSTKQPALFPFLPSIKVNTGLITLHKIEKLGTVASKHHQSHFFQKKMVPFYREVQPLTNQRGTWKYICSTTKLLTAHSILDRDLHFWELVFCSIKTLPLKAKPESYTTILITSYIRLNPLNSTAAMY